MYAAGSTEDIAGPLAFGGLSIPVPETYMMFVLRMDASGNGSWARLAHDVTFQVPDVACDPFGNAFVSGGLLDSTTFGAIAFHGPNWVNDVFLTKVDSTGDFLWGVESAPASAAITGDFARAKRAGIATNASGGVYLLGTLRGTTDWGNGVVSDGITLGTTCLGVVAFDPGGVAQWAVSSIPGGAVVSHTLTADEAGILYFSANILGQFTLSPFTVNSGGQQAFCDGRINGIGTGTVPPTESMLPVRAWPMPFNHDFHLETPLGSQLRVWNAQGSLVHSGMAGTGTFGGEWPPGMYALSIGNGPRSQYLRVVKQ
jgi:hypothetical protein